MDKRTKAGIIAVSIGILIVVFTGYFLLFKVITS